MEEMEEGHRKIISKNSKKAGRRKGGEKDRERKKGKGGRREEGEKG